jgi:hypothetical protein
MALFKIPIASKRGTYFTYEGTQITLSPLRENGYMGKDAWVIDISWEENNVIKTVGGVVLVAGTNLLGQYSLPIPSLLVLSSSTPNDDPTSVNDINLYIKDRT